MPCRRTPAFQRRDPNGHLRLRFFSPAPTGSGGGELDGGAAEGARTASADTAVWGCSAALEPGASSLGGAGGCRAAGAALVGCDAKTVRQTIHAFNARGGAALTKRSSRPQTTHPIFTPAATAALRDRLHRSPREFGPPTSVWTLEVAAQVCAARGITARRVTGEAIRKTLRQGVLLAHRPPRRRRPCNLRHTRFPQPLTRAAIIIRQDPLDSSRLDTYADMGI